MSSVSCDCRRTLLEPSGMDWRGVVGAKRRLGQAGGIRPELGLWSWRGCLSLRWREARGRRSGVGDLGRGWRVDIYATGL